MLRGTRRSLEPGLYCNQELSWPSLPNVNRQGHDRGGRFDRPVLVINNLSRIRNRPGGKKREFRRDRLPARPALLFCEGTTTRKAAVRSSIAVFQPPGTNTALSPFGSASACSPERAMAAESETIGKRRATTAMRQAVGLCRTNPHECQESRHRKKSMTIRA